MFYDHSGLALAAPPEVPDMMGLQSEYVQTQCILADGGDRFGVSALAFDRYEELLWMGNQGGHVTSYYTGALQKYTSFQIHASEDVRQILTLNDGILGLTASSLRCQIRRGIPVFTHTSANMAEMQCMLQLSNNRILMGGHHGKLIDFNLDLCKETKVLDVGETGCVMLRPHSRFVCGGNPLGRIDLRDPNTLKAEHSLETHTGSLSDFDVQGNLLITCGFSKRHGNLTVDRFLMVYDLRMMRAVTPIQTVLDPLYLRFMPSVSSRLAVVSGLGHAQILDTVAFAESRLCYMQMESAGMCLTFDISATSQALAYGDDTGQIHLFSSTAQPLFNSYSRMTEHADPLVTYHSFAVDDYDTPLSIIPMPINHDATLSSNWPAHLMKKCYRKPVGIDPEVLRTMKMKGSIGYAPNSRTTRRNQVAYDIDNNRIRTPQKSGDGRIQKSDENDGFVAIPKRYRKIDIKYNKLGTDEYQFDQFNKTGLTGLDATLPNAYCNAMIQVLYYVEPLRATLLSHMCNKEFCLSCELGFLFHMLKTSSNNYPCQAANFLRAFRTIPEASALGLVYSDLPPDQKTKVNLGALIQSWNRFIVHQLHVELAEARKKSNERKASAKAPFSYNVLDFPAIHDRKRYATASEINANMEQEKKGSESEIIELIGTKQQQKHSCLKCKVEVKKESILLVCNLIYPTNEPDKDEWSFCDILAKSLCSQQTTPAWCDPCRKFSPTLQTKVSQSLPKLLAINTGLHNPQHKQFWQTQMDKVVAKASTTSISASNHETPSSTTTTTQATTSSPLLSSTTTTSSSVSQQSFVSPNVSTSNVNVNPNSLSSSKPCRYGDHCSRPGCRFRHSFDALPPPPPANNLYCSNNWLPHSISISLNGEELVIEKIEDKSPNDPNSDSSSSFLEPLSSSSFTADHPDASNTTGNSANSGGGELLSSSTNNNSTSSNTSSHSNTNNMKKLQYDLTAVVCFVNDQSQSQQLGGLSSNSATSGSLNSSLNASLNSSMLSSGSPNTSTSTSNSADKRNVVALIRVPESYMPPAAAPDQQHSAFLHHQQHHHPYSHGNRAAADPYYHGNKVNAAAVDSNSGGGHSNNDNNRWYLFNDFSITPVSSQEAVWFSLDWKVPCILYYSTREVTEARSIVVPPLSRDVFTEDACIARSGTTSGITFTPLSDNEFPKRGDLVAMDAEFVTLNQEEAELRSDGKMSMIKPSQMSVARITCIRGFGPMEGIPFIDDYISTQEQVVDYLTKFSGIKPGDLDANFSSKHLTTLKSTYTKLRFLLDSGVVFVGHGLKNDFSQVRLSNSNDIQKVRAVELLQQNYCQLGMFIYRVINLVVPPEQVADTVHLFHLPHHRMVSLRFLAWHFLGVKIQSETHDSVEDARAALHLYKKYKQLEAQNKVVDALAELYERGKLLNWKVPEDS